MRVGAVRTGLLSAVPLLSDAVLAGENADFVCVLAWLNVAEAVRLLGMKPESDGEVIVDERLHRLLTQALAEYNDSGSSARIERLLVMARPADLDAGEITDKGYVNQRKVLHASALGPCSTPIRYRQASWSPERWLDALRECRDHLPCRSYRDQ